MAQHQVPAPQMTDSELLEALNSGEECSEYLYELVKRTATSDSFFDYWFVNDPKI